MVLERSSMRDLSVAVEELQHVQDDPQAVLTSLVRLHGILVSAPVSAGVSLPSTPSLATTVEFLQQLLLRYAHAAEEEIVWFVCRIATAWSRVAHRFQLEAGRTRLWDALQAARVAFPESPRVLEASLEATVALFHGVELHQLFNARAQPHMQLVDEMLQLMDRFDCPPARAALRSPHYDFSQLVVLALAVLTQLFSSRRVVAMLGNDREHTYAGETLRRMAQMLPKHFLIAADATRTWLSMARLQLQHLPPLAVEVLFLNTTRAAFPSWCQAVVDKWRDHPQILHDLCALSTQIFAVPHAVTKSHGLHSSAHDAFLTHHGLLRIMVELLDDYGERRRSTSATRTETERLDPVVLEIVRCIRQWSRVPEMLAAFADVPIARKTLVPVLVREIDFCLVSLRTPAALADVTGRKSKPELLLILELVLTVQQLIAVGVFSRALQTADSLQGSMAHLLKLIHTQSVRSSSSAENAGDSELPAVVQRELKKAIALLATIPFSSSSSTRGKLGSTSQGLRRVPSSSSLAASRQSSITRGALTVLTSHSSSLTVRRTPSSSTIVQGHA